ncbi:MAG: glucose-6-phosphate isomerase [Pseudomonadota bacterium]
MNENEMLNCLQERAIEVKNKKLNSIENQNNYLIYENFYFDFSKQYIDKKILALLLNFVKNRDIKRSISDLFSDKKINTTENRSALHWLLRAPSLSEVSNGLKPIHRNIIDNVTSMSSLIKIIHDGAWLGVNNQVIDCIVNIGVGGSDLGPAMVISALKEFRPENSSHISIHFVATMDGTDLLELFKTIDPAKTLFVYASKSFSTLDTQSNASTALEWMKSKFPGSAVSNILEKHFIGITSKPDKAENWGIPTKHILTFDESIGGRYSLWSTIGFSIAVAIGMENFNALLSGANSMDEHFQNAPLETNLPLIMALVNFWNVRFLNFQSQLILPYDGRLKLLPAYLQQLEMESNGKSVNHKGELLKYNTSPILWGDVGTKGQHAFYQLLHQGTHAVMCDFIVFADSEQQILTADKSVQARFKYHKKINIANCLAQAELLAFGSNSAFKKFNLESNPHKIYSGGKPSNMILIKELTPYSLGQLVSLYEHKVFTLAALWDINPFDQWGVELGKKIADTTYLGLEDDNALCQELSDGTLRLMKQINNFQ